MKRVLSCAVPVAAAIFSTAAAAANVKVEIPVKEIELTTDNAGTRQLMWTYGGAIPGPLVRVREGDLVEFKLVNEKGNKTKKGCCSGNHRNGPIHKST